MAQIGGMLPPAPGHCFKNAPASFSRACGRETNDLETTIDVDALSTNLVLPGFPPTPFSDHVLNMLKNICRAARVGVANNIMGTCKPYFSPPEGAWDGTRKNALNMLAVEWFQGAGFRYLGRIWPNTGQV